MSDYPDPEEEFELMYGDEYDLLQEHEDDLQHTSGPKSRKSLDFSTQKANNNKNVSEPKPGTSKDPPVSTPIHENSFDRDFQTLEDTNQRKRGLDDLFGDIDDIIIEEQYSKPKKSKTHDESIVEKLLEIDRILEKRKTNQVERNPFLTVGNINSCSNLEHIKNNLSFRVPKYPFIGVTRHDGERIYVRMHSEEYELEDIRRITSKNTARGLMGASFKEIWTKANNILNQTLEINPDSVALDLVQESQDTKLWVDMYKPRKYIELLSDEGTNRTLLKWIKLWDKCVFHRKIKPRSIKPTATNTYQPFQKQELDLTLDETDRPKLKVALLCGPPGLGKTTLAHMVAKHSGYNVVEINASDERNLDSFKQALENATQMQSVLDADRKPNCLIFDEIDGAPAVSIEYLVKFINGTATTRAKKGKKQAKVLKRPIICICNDVYVPALRQLRQNAFILNFPPTATGRLAERLLEIARLQNIETNQAAMFALAEKSNNDIRSCLSILHFFKTKKKPVTFAEIRQTNVGRKDVQQGLFQVWQNIFQIQRFKHMNDAVPMRVRMEQVLNSVVTFGDYDRLTQGIFENYPMLREEVKQFAPICTALDWFSYTDGLNKKILETQNYSLYSYLPYGFVVWHFVFGSFNRKKISYPSVGYEVSVKTTKCTAILSEILRGLSSSLRSYTSANSLRLDILPAFAIILTPSLRTVNMSFFAPNEKTQIKHVVNIMIDYNLTYVQERNASGAYVYCIDPNIDEIITFNGLKVHRNSLSYNNKNMIAREIEVEKMRREQTVLNRGIVNKTEVDKTKLEEGKRKVEDKKKEEAKKENIPNHLQRLKAKIVVPKEKVIAKDFFGRIITKVAKPKFGDNSSDNSSNDLWFQFKEGYNNAVKRKIKYKSLL